MTREEKISLIKERIASFTDEDFGELLPCPKAEKKPKYIPPKDVHPRLCFTAKRIEEIKRNLTCEENKYAYDRYIELSETECDGVVRDFTDSNGISHMRIVDANILTILNAKAFRYALTGDEVFGYEAIAGVLSYLKTYDLSQIPAGMAHYTSMRIMEKVAWIYDWCYDLLRAEDKHRIACAGTSKICKYMEYPDFPPRGGGVMVGHMSGTIFLGAWSSMGIAIYDEHPEYYDLIANIIHDQLVPSQNFMKSSGEHPQGSAYGTERINMLLYGDMIFSAMYDNEVHLFDKENFEQACLTFLHMIRPDGELLRIGDEFNEGTRYAGLIKTAFFGAYLYKNPILKGFARAELNDFSTFFPLTMTPITFLIFNRPELECAPLSDLPLVKYNGSPMGSMYARTSWTDKNAVMTYMKIGESYSGNHEHRDAGHFQIYHKGILLSDSGLYGLYGNEIDRHYNKQTIAHNSILVYNPNRTDTKKWVYSGGQRIDNLYSEEAMDCFDWQKKPSFGIGKVLYHGSKIENGTLKYTLLCGDITKAYDEDTVSEVKRYMFSLNTERGDHPLAFFMFDRITSVDESYEKKILFHMQTLPMVIDLENGKQCAMVTNLSSRLYIQPIGSDVNFEIIGGENNEFNVKGVNYERSRMRETGLPFTFMFNVEDGWGRIEMTPKNPAKTDCVLSVMYIAPDLDYAPRLVFGDSNVMPFHEAIEIKAEGVLGASLLGNVAIFPENGNGFDSKVKFTIPEKAKAKKCYIIGLSGGEWKLSDGRTVTVSKEEGIAEFEVKENEIELIKL